MKKGLLFVVMVLLAGCVCWALLGNLSAADGGKPTSTCPTPYSMKVENLPPKKGLFTPYYFAPDADEQLSVSITLQTADGASGQAKILLFQVGLDENIDSFSPEAFRGNVQLSHTFTGLNSEAFYYLRIENTGSGFLAKEPSLNGTLAIE